MTGSPYPMKAGRGGCAGRALVPLALLVLSTTASAAYPERPIRLIISSAAGGSPDIVTRILAAELVKQMGQQIIIDNRPGAAQTIGTEMVVRATPDGYTIGYANVVTLAINKSLLPKQPYDPDKDLVLVGQFLSTYNLLAVTLAAGEIGEGARSTTRSRIPGKLLNASAGNGTTGHLGGELFKIMTGTQIVHVPYKGSPQGITDLIAGQVQLMFDNLTSISPHVKSGKLRGLGVSNLKRSPIFPGHADDLGSRRARLRNHGVGRHRRARGHAAGHRREAQRRDQQGAAVAGAEGTLRRDRGRARRRHARGSSPRS